MTGPGFKGTCKMNNDKQSMAVAAPPAQNQSPDSLFAELASGPEGLTSLEAKKRLEKRTESVLFKFLDFFLGPIAGMTEVKANITGQDEVWARREHAISLHFRDDNWLSTSG